MSVVFRQKLVYKICTLNILLHDLPYKYMPKNLYNFIVVTYLHK